jgi:hypothetical protein
MILQFELFQTNHMSKPQKTLNKDTNNSNTILHFFVHLGRRQWPALPGLCESWPVSQAMTALSPLLAQVCLEEVAFHSIRQ